MCSVPQAATMDRWIVIGIACLGGVLAFSIG
jgi:hypothetical protein